MFTLPDPSPKGNSRHARADGYGLTEEILALSVADTWDAARREWELSHVYRVPADDPGTCLCGHFPILEHCVIANRRNANTAVVGSVRVTRFLGLPSAAIFAGLDRIAGDRGKALTAAALEHAHARGWVNDWELGFYRDTMRKPQLSYRQRSKRVEINERVLDRAGMATVGEGCGHA
jgi:hypothetical protein